MPETYARVFKDPEKLSELVTLLSVENPNYVNIGLHFGCDHTSVIYQAKKLGLWKKRMTWGFLTYEEALERRRAYARAYGKKIRGLTLEEWEAWQSRKKRKGHCGDCDILLSYGGSGTEDYCEGCANERGIV